MSNNIYSLAQVMREKKENIEVLTFNKNGENSTIFAIPGLGEHSLIFTHLAENLKNINPFYGLESIGINGDKYPLNNMEDVVKTNITNIKNINKKGPYIIIGHSYGASIAYETVYKLQELGDKVDAFIILDSPYPSKIILGDNSEDDIIYNILRPYLLSLGINLKEELFFEYGNITKTEIIEYLEKQGISISLQQLTGFINTVISQINISHSYTPKKMQKELLSIFIRAKEHINNESLDYNWDALLKNPSKKFIIPGDHISILDKNHSKNIADIIGDIGNIGESDNTSLLR